MAIDFDSGNGSLFYRLGRVLHVAYLLDVYQAAVPASFTALIAQYNSTLQNVIGPTAAAYPGLVPLSSQVMNFTTGGEGSVNLGWDTILATVYGDQPNQSWTRRSAMAEVVRQMGLQSKTVTANVISCTPTAISGSVGTGVIVVSTLRNDGLVQENTIAETLRVTCTIDSYTGGATQGQEQFSLVGAPAATGSNNSIPVGTWDYNYPLGSAAAVQTNAISAFTDASSVGNLLTNGSLALWSSDPAPTLTNWVLQVGTWGTDAQQDDTDPYQGDFDLQINAGSANTQLYQEFASSTGTSAEPSALTAYAVNFWIKRTGVVSAGVLTVELIDDAGTVVKDDQNVDNSYTITLSGVATSYAASNAVFRLPQNPPDTMRLQFRISTDLAGASIRIASISFAPMVSMYTGGPTFCIFSGAVPFVGGDGWSIANTNNQGGASNLATFQTGFQRLFDMRSLGLMLPSAVSGSIANTLITS